MRELIGHCESCGREVYCENGFFTGIHIEGKLFCSSCGMKATGKKDSNRDSSLKK